MNRRVVLVFLILGLIAAARHARGQVYTGAVLYQMANPIGLMHGGPSPSAQASEDGQMVGTSDTSDQSPHAVLWTTAGAVVDLHPNGFDSSYGQGTNGSQQVGLAVNHALGEEHAMLWTGSAAGAVDLNPTDLQGFSYSAASATDGAQQVGWGGMAGSNSSHALIWSGTAASAVDLNPTNLSEITTSAAWGTDGAQQVGSGASSSGAEVHALVWNGTAASAVDLQPAGFESSVANAVYGGQQVGSGYQIGVNDVYALLWTGTAASVVNLGQGTALGTNGKEQVGFSRGNIAELWHGNSGSEVDLQSLLPQNASWSNGSRACSIDTSGVAYGYANGSLNGVFGSYSVEWFPSALWAAGVSGNWSTATSWSSQTLPTSTIGATFNTGTATPYTVTLTGNTAPNVLYIQGDNVKLQKAGYNLTIPGATIITGTTSRMASLTIAGTGDTTLSSLNINEGQLDITDNTVIINYGVGNPSPVGSIGNFITGGFNGGAWNGVGIVSSKVASVNAVRGNPHLYGVGYADASDSAVAGDGFTPGTVVIEPALVGDANLDGKVNFTDFLLLSASFNKPGTSWDQGNFNYGSTTNFGDFLLLTANFNQSTSLDNADLDAMNNFAKSFGDTLVPNSDGIGFTIVPEPASIGIVGILATGLLARRRRKCKIIFRHR